MAYAKRITEESTWEDVVKVAKESITPEEFPALRPQADEPATYVLVNATK